MTACNPQTVAANEPVAAPATVESRSADYVVPTTTSGPAFVPATRLTNYVVAHSEYSSPLARRSVLTGVLTEDDGDPDVATTTITDETKDDPKKSSAQSQ